VRWRNHNLLTAMAVYSITGGFLSSIVASAGAILPDLLEIGGLIRHRIITHWPYPYLFVAGILYLWQSNTPSLTAYLMFFLALGVVLHILLDALSLTGVSCWAYTEPAGTNSFEDLYDLLPQRRDNSSGFSDHSVN